MTDTHHRDARWRPHTHAWSGLPKHRYPTMAEAVAAAERIRDDDLVAGRMKGRDPCPYECSDPECGGWHVGNWSDEAYANRPATD